MDAHVVSAVWPQRRNAANSSYSAAALGGTRTPHPKPTTATFGLAKRPRKSSLFARLSPPPPALASSTNDNDPGRCSARARRTHHHDRRRQRHRHPLEHRPGLPQLPEIAYLLGSDPAEWPARRARLRRRLRPPLRRLSRLLGTRHGTTRGAHHHGAVRRRPLRRCLARQRRAAGRRPVQHRRPVPLALALGPLRRHHDRRRRHRRGAPQRWSPPLVVDVHPDRPDQRGILTPLDIFAMLPPEPTIEAIETAGGHVVTPRRRARRRRPLPRQRRHPRQTSYETGLPGHHTWRGEQVTLDPGIHDERFLAANVRGRGTTVLTACSHAGVVNVGLEARRLLPDQPVDLLLGGYHLAGTTVEDRIEPTVQRPHRTSSRPGSSRQDTAPAGEPPPRSRTRSARTGSLRASSERGTYSTPLSPPT